MTCPSASRRCAAPSPGATTSSTSRGGGCLSGSRSSGAGFDLAAAEAICGPAAESATTSSTRSAASRTRACCGSRSARGEPRFAMLETIREFAGEMLDGRAEAAARCAADRDWFLDLPGARRRSSPGPTSAPGWTGWSWSTTTCGPRWTGRRAAGRRQTAIGLAFALWRFWQKRGHLAEARRRLEAMAAASWSHDQPPLRARLMEALGGVAGGRATSRDEGALQRGGGAVADDRRRARSSRTPTTTRRSRSRTVRGRTGDPTREDASAALPRGGPRPFFAARRPGGEANVLWGLGNHHYFRGRPGAGADEFGAALGYPGRMGDRTMEAWSLHMLGVGLDPAAADDGGARAAVHAVAHFHAAGDVAGLTPDPVRPGVGRGPVRRPAARRPTARRGAQPLERDRDRPRDVRRGPRSRRPGCARASCRSCPRPTWSDTARRAPQ